MDATFVSRLESVIDYWNSVPSDRKAMAESICKSLDAFMRGDVKKDDVIFTIRDEIQYYISEEQYECYDAIVGFLDDNIQW